MSRHRIGGWRIDVERRQGEPRILPAIALARTVGRALEGGSAPSPASIALILGGDLELAELNATHMGHTGPTDVLSFPLLPPEVFRSGAATPTFAIMALLTGVLGGGEMENALLGGGMGLA